MFFLNYKYFFFRPEEERKIQLCSHVLNVLSKVDPGFTKWRGNVLQVKYIFVNPIPTTNVKIRWVNLFKYHQ